MDRAAIRLILLWLRCKRKAKTKYSPKWIILSKWGILIVGTPLLGIILAIKIKTAHKVGGKYFKEIGVSVFNI